MVEKVTVGTVLDGTLDLFKERANFIAGMFVLLLIASASADLQSLKAVNAELQPELWVSLILAVGVGTVVQVLLFNNFISTLRGEKFPGYPAAIVGKFLRTIFREILLILVVLVPYIVSLLGVGIVVGVLAGLTDQESTSLMNDTLVSVVAMLSMVLPAVRLGAGIAAAAMGEKISFKESWKMTKGYTWTLTLFAVPMIGVQAYARSVLGPLFASGDIHILSPHVLVYLLLSCASYMFTYVAFSVWYVRLRDQPVAIPIVSDDGE